MFLNAYMFRFTCLGFYAMFSMFCSSFCSMLMLGLCAHMLDIMFMVMLGSDLCVLCFLPCYVLRSASVHAYMLGFMFYHVYVLSSHTFTHVAMIMRLDLHFYMLACSNLGFHLPRCLYLCFHMLICPDLCSYMPICPDLCFHMPMCLDLCSLYTLCYVPYACALHAMFVCPHLGYVCHAMCYCSPFVVLSFFLVFWSIGSDSI